MANTNYLAVVGRKTVWPKDKTTKLDEILDGASNTIMLVEVADSDINWMEPGDLSFEEAARGINPKSSAGISSRHSWGEDYFHYGQPVVNLAFADGSVHVLPEGLLTETLKGLLTIDGEEDVDVDLIDEQGSRRPLNWTRCSALVALVVSVLLLLLRPRPREPRGPLTAVSGD